MHNTYFGSTIYAIRCKESISVSYNGYSNFWYDRFDRTPSHCSSCCGCCDCCALSTYRVPIKPSLLNGLRQSTLLHLSASRRIILGGGGRYFSRLPAYGLHRGYELNCSANETNFCNRNKNKIKERYFRAASQKGREIRHSFDSDDTEAVLSLLSEDVEKDAIGIKWKNTSSSKRMETEKKRRNVNRERNLSLSKKAETKEKGNLKQHATSAIDLKREDEKPNNDWEATTKRENHWKRRDLSSCSSYYSFSSGDFGSDVEVQDKHGFEELSVGYEKDDTNNVEGQVKEEFKGQIDDSEKLQGVSNVFGTDIDWNLRKKNEKNLTEVTVQESEFTKEYQDMNSRAFRTHESSYGKASISQKQVDSEEDKSSFVKDLDTKTKKAYIQTGNLRKHHFTYIQESGGDEVEITLPSRKAFSGSKGNNEISETMLQETSDQHKKLVGSTTGKETSKSKKTFNGREGNLEISETLLQEASDEHKKFPGSTSTAEKDVINRNSQKYIENAKIEDTKRTSNTRMKNLGAKEVLGLSSIRGVEEQQHQKEEKIVTQAKGRRKSQQFSEVSQVHESNVEDTSIMKSRTRIKNSKENSNLSKDARGTLQQTDNKRNPNFQHREISELVITSSEDYASDPKQVSSSHRTSEKVRFTPKSKLMPVVKTRESSCQTDERITDFELARDDQRPRNLSMFEKNASREESGFQGSMTLVSESGSRGSAHFEFTTGISSPEIFLETSPSGSSALYDNSGSSPALLSGIYSRGGSDQGYSEPSNNMAPEDALGSADRLEKSSKLFVDEFVERVRHEVTTSETQEVEVTGTKLAFEDERNKVYSSRHQGTQNDSQLKEHDSSRSSGFPGAKGPSDEMWDVTEPSVEQSQVAEELEISKEADQPFVSRT